MGHAEVTLPPDRSHVATEQRNAPGRPRILYAVTARPVPDDESATAAANYRILARVLIEQIAARSRSAREAHEIARRAGETWAAATGELTGSRTVGDEEQAYEVLVAMMRDLGFDPRPEPDKHRIVLHACPYLDSPRDQLPVICGVHQGLLEGTLHQLEAPVAAAGLDVRLNPTRCVVHLQQRPETD